MFISYGVREYLLLGVYAWLLLLGEHHLPLCCDLNAFPQRLLQLLDAVLFMTEGVLQRESVQRQDIKIVLETINAAFIKEGVNKENEKLFWGHLVTDKVFILGRTSANKSSQRLRRQFTPNHKCEPHGDARRKVRAQGKSKTMNDNKRFYSNPAKSGWAILVWTQVMDVHPYDGQRD